MLFYIIHTSGLYILYYRTNKIKYNVIRKKYFPHKIPNDLYCDFIFIQSLFSSFQLSKRFFYNFFYVHLFGFVSFDD